MKKYYFTAVYIPGLPATFAVPANTLVIRSTDCRRNASVNGNNYNVINYCFAGNMTESKTVHQNNSIISNCIVAVMNRSGN